MTSNAVLWWPGRILAEDDLRRHWNSQSEIVLGPKTLVTPLAWDFLRSKRIAIRRDDVRSVSPLSATWGIAEQTPSPLVASALKAIEGRSFLAMGSAKGTLPDWVRSIALKVAAGNPVGALVFSDHPGLASCVANKVRGIRAAMVSQPGEVKTLQQSLGPNVIAITSGRTYFELRQIVKLATESAPTNPIGDLDANR